MKRLVALFLVLLLSIESFGAVVSDNDGSAFITKAEFDSLKNNFQSQIDQYYTSIDSKIDGAIASYLAGIAINKEISLDDLIGRAKTADICNVSFCKWEAPNATLDVPDVYAGLYWRYNDGYSNIKDSERREGVLYDGIQICNQYAYNGRLNLVKYRNYDEQVNNFQSKYYFVNFPFAQPNEINHRSYGNLNDFSLVSHVRKNCTFILTSTYTGWSASPGVYDDSSWLGEPTSVTVDFINDRAGFAIGPYVSETAQAFSFYYKSGIRPINGIAHTWSDFDDNQRNQLKLDYMIAGDVSGNDKFIDFDFRDSYVADNQLNLPIALTRPTTETGVGGKSGGWIHSSIWHTSGGGYWESMNVKKGLTSAYTNNIEFNWKWNRQKIYDLSWERLTNEYYNSQFSYPYYVYYGIPICKTPTRPGKFKLKLKFTNKILTSLNPLNPSLGGYTYVIMDKMFKNGDLPTMSETDSYYIDEDGYNHVMRRETIDTGDDSVWITDWLEFDKGKIIDGNNGDYIYIKIEPNNPDQVVQVEVADSILYVED